VYFIRINCSLFVCVCFKRVKAISIP